LLKCTKNQLNKTPNQTEDALDVHEQTHLVDFSLESLREKAVTIMTVMEVTMQDVEKLVKAGLVVKGKSFKRKAAKRPYRYT